MESKKQSTPSESDGLPEGAPDGLKTAADTGNGQIPDITIAQERGALDFILGPTAAVEFDVPVRLDTPTGEKPLIFRIKQMDGKRLLALEVEHKEGTGPFAPTDDVALDAHIVSEATVEITDGLTGASIDPKSMEFLGNATTPFDAMRTRFKFTPGIMTGIAAQVRSVSGYNPEKVKSAERVIADAVGK